jgi:hypothetical protein
VYLARLAGSLSHPNIVTVHDYFECGGGWWWPSCSGRSPSTSSSQIGGSCDRSRTPFARMPGQVDQATSETAGAKAGTGSGTATGPAACVTARTNAAVARSSAPGRVSTTLANAGSGSSIGTNRTPWAT